MFNIKNDKFFLLFIFLLLVISLSGCSNSNTTKQLNNNQSTNNSIQNNTDYNTTSSNNISIEKTSSPPPKTVEEEEELFSYTTKVIDKSADRKTNVDITISKINGYRLEPGKTFSFCDIVGKATPEKGYKKAKIFDENGKMVDGYGGGNCQVSSTIYNAVKDLDGIEIVERHHHAKDVPYVGKGLDAAVAYGSIDFKFKNNNDYPIIIYLSNTTDNVSCTIKKITKK